MRTFSMAGMRVSIECAIYRFQLKVGLMPKKKSADSISKKRLYNRIRSCFHRLDDADFFDGWYASFHWKRYIPPTVES